MSLASPNPDIPQLAFYQAVAWLYAFFNEAGRTSVRFLSKSAVQYVPDQDLAYIRAYSGDIVRLRTTLQHNLNLSDERDLETDARSEQWFNDVCGKRRPESLDDWIACYSKLLTGGEMVLRTLEEVAAGIEGDDVKETICEQWRRALLRFHEAWEFDRIISEVARDLGHPSVDVKRFRDRNSDVWRERLEQLDDGYHFDFEARRLVERSMLTDWLGVLPITGHEVMATLQMGPGMDVRRALELATQMYAEAPCHADELLARLKSAWVPTR